MNYLLWQLADSGFPAGGFAHSGGLEAAVQHGLVPDSQTVRAFARQAMAQAGRSALPLVTAAHRDPRSLGELDRLSDAFLTNPVANRASRAQGRAFMTATSRSFPHVDLVPLDRAIQVERLCAHYAPLFGAVLTNLGIDERDTQRLFLFMAGRGIGSAAVRLGVTGAFDAQELQNWLAPEIDQIIDRCGSLGPLEISQTAPLIDLCQSTHDRLYSRLFQS